MKRSFLKLALLLFTFLLCALFAGAHSVDDGFDPNANGVVYAVLVQPNGQILIGGGFTRVQGVPLSNIARLNPDGSVDTTFHPDPDGTVFTIALQSDGKVLMGGTFRTCRKPSGLGRRPCEFIVRLKTTGTVDTTFDASLNSAVHSIVVDSGGNVLVGGAFTNINGQPVNRIARLEANGSLDSGFNPDANGIVRTIAIQADGQVLAGGTFTSIRGRRRNHIARLDKRTGEADLSFDPNADDSVNSIVMQTDGKILIGGWFVSLSIPGERAVTRRHIARLNANGSLDAVFNPDANGRVNSIAVQSDGKILVGGWFSRIGVRDFRNYIARLDSITGSADSFNPSANLFVESIAVQSDGKVLLAGQFDRVGGHPRNHISRLATNGSLDRTLINSNSTGPILATAVQRDGKILIGGIFNTILGVPRNNIARLNADGTLDPDFNPGANAVVQSIAVQSDDHVLVGGQFNVIDGELRNCIARLTPEGRVDSFDPQPNSPCAVHAIAVQADGNILVGGKFTTIGRQARNRLARLDSGSGLADAFDPNSNGLVLSIAVQSDKKILIGGDFTTLSPNSGEGVERNHIARLEVSGGVDMGFDPNANRAVHSIAVQADGEILAGGSFTIIGGRRRGSLARLRSDGRIDTGFDPNASCSPPVVCTVRSIAVQADGRVLAGGVFNAIDRQPRNYIARLGAKFGDADSFNPILNRSVYSIALQSDGKVFVAGEFYDIGGERRNGFARFSNETAALSNLAITPTTITWTRAGSAPQLTRATFEYSWDNGMCYLPLGDATSTITEQAPVYSLTGIRLPTGRNILIRARGYFRSGYLNGSESMAEQVQVAFLAPPAKSINLLRNHSFEEFFCDSPTTPCLGQMLMPSDWERLNVTPDTYSDGRYGISPDLNANFAGAAAQNGVLYVGAGAGLDFGKGAEEIFGQLLTSPLIPGQEYTLTAHLLKASRLAISSPGTYQIELWQLGATTITIPKTRINLGPLEPHIAETLWRQSTLTFTAPVGAELYPILVFRPVIVLDPADPKARNTYPGIDNVVLMVSSPTTARVTAGGRCLRF